MRAIQEHFGFLLLAFAGLVVLFAMPLGLNLACPEEQPATWHIQGYDYPAPKQNEPQRREYTAQQEKQAAKTDTGTDGHSRNLTNRIFCKDFRLTDWALVFFTYALVLVGLFAMISADENTKRKERAYVIATGLRGIEKPEWKDTWERANRTKASMFNGPHWMGIQNMGNTPGFTTHVHWGICSDEIFREGLELTKDGKVSQLFDNTIQLIAWRARCIRTDESRVQDIFRPMKDALHYRHVAIEEEERKPGNVFFGVIHYKDVFRAPHYSTWALQITKDGEHTDGIANAYADDHD